MANLPEANEYPAGIYQIETTDPVLGGPPNEATKAGLANIPSMQLAKRTNWLKNRVDTLLGKVIPATTLVAGLVRLSNAIDSNSQTEAATPKAVRDAFADAEARTNQAIAAQYANRNLVTNGYQVLPSGMVMQWGSAFIESGGNSLITFPMAFPSACLNISITDFADTNTTSHVHDVSVNQIGRTNFRVFAVNANGQPVSTFFYFLAIGR